MRNLDPATTVIAGDWHGNTRWAMAAIAHAAAAGGWTILHLGDYGYRFAAGYRAGVESALDAHGMELMFVRGNHDDPTYLDGLEVDEHGHGIVSKRVTHLRDGSRIAVGDEIAVALGGAGSIDRATRVSGQSWWKDEVTGPEVITRAAAAGPADIVLAHDCPAGIDLALDPAFGQYFEDIDPGVLDYCEQNRLRLWEAADALRPQLWLHGHYHKAIRRSLRLGATTMTTVGLDCDGTTMQDNLLRLDRA